jgi:hypothetical protein
MSKVKSQVKSQPALTVQERVKRCGEKWAEFERELEKQNCVHVTIPPPNRIQKIFLRLGGNPVFGEQHLVVPREQLKNK